MALEEKGFTLNKRAKISGAKLECIRRAISRTVISLWFLHDTTAEDILIDDPDWNYAFQTVPGDPEMYHMQLDMNRGLLGKVPNLRICLGHQFNWSCLWRKKQFKLKFGHRGGYHPGIKTWKKILVLAITSQNHGYAFGAIKEWVTKDHHQTPETFLQTSPSQINYTSSPLTDEDVMTSSELEKPKGMENASRIKLLKMKKVPKVLSYNIHAKETVGIGISYDESYNRLNLTS
ncbi:hypothetical protein FQA39_LY18648 [Lamprigera yunnana]|nr:hypothetical protein FQA39_LY18648 [Lamprigera yunnana]